jgi:hypothetical protein
MALSDACGDFIAALSEGNAPHKVLVKKLFNAVDGFDVLVGNACCEVLDAPSGSNASRATWLAALTRLVILAEQTRVWHDTPPAAKQQCPECGAWPFTAADSKRMDAYWARKDSGDWPRVVDDEGDECPF